VCVRGGRGGVHHCPQNAAVGGADAQMPGELIGKLFRLSGETRGVELQHQEVFLCNVLAGGRRKETEEHLPSRVHLHELACEQGW